MERDFNKISEWLLPILESRGLSVEQLANSTGVTRASIYHWLTDRNRPRTQAMARICRFLNVPFEEGLAQFTPRKYGRPKGKRAPTKKFSRYNSY